MLRWLWSAWLKVNLPDWTNQRKAGENCLDGQSTLVWRGRKERKTHIKIENTEKFIHSDRDILSSYEKMVYCHISSFVLIEKKLFCFSSFFSFFHISTSIYPSIIRSAFLVNGCGGAGANRRSQCKVLSQVCPLLFWFKGG